MSVTPSIFLFGDADYDIQTVLYDWAGYPALRQKRLGIHEDSAVDPSLVTSQGKTWVPGNLLHNIKVRTAINL